MSNVPSGWNLAPMMLATIANAKMITANAKIESETRSIVSACDVLLWFKSC